MRYTIILYHVGERGSYRFEFKLFGYEKNGGRFAEDVLNDPDFFSRVQSTRRHNCFM